MLGSKLKGDPANHLTNNFSIIIQIWWKFNFIVTPLLIMTLLQTFPYAMTALLSCHVQNFIATNSWKFGWEQHEILIELKVWWKNHRCSRLWLQIIVLVVNYGISNTIVLEIPYFTTKKMKCMPLSDNTSPYHAALMWGKIKNVFTYCTISGYSDGSRIWNLFIWKTWTCFSYTITVTL